jgi:hypothetical protein
MDAETGSHDWRGRKLREWLLLLLRFAVTREPSDRSAVLAMADELDSLGTRWRPVAPTFFLRTSFAICEAILGFNDARALAVLRQHLARIDDPRLRRAFQAAAGLSESPEPPRGPAAIRRKRQDLWKGLAKR